MRISRTYPSRLLSVSFLLILTCSIASLAKKSPPHTGGQTNAILTITSAGPNAGPLAGGTAVTITGTAFQRSASVIFGGLASPAVTYVSSTELRAITPAHASGTVSIVVNQNPHNQSATLAAGFTYSDSLGVSSVDPSQGTTSGGTVVTITGTGFEAGVTVAFGNIQSSAVAVASSTQINAMAPPGNAGTVAISVTIPDGQSASLTSAFTYTSGPAVTSVSPNSGPVTGGTTVTILGSGFQSGATVTFGATLAASTTLVNSSEIQAVSPGSAAGTISITVANGDSQTGSLAAAFTFYHAVSLSWQASASTVSGYNIYRGSEPGGPYAKLNSGLVPGTTFTDNNVQAGQTYFYVATAVDGNSMESAYSNEAEAIVPNP